jgi:phenylacetic acid degradation protein
MAKVYSYEGIVPVVHPSAFVHPDAVLVGDVHVGPACYVGPCAVLRGDFGRITLEFGANIQETCVAHAFPGKDVLVEEAGHIGHGAVLHGCHIGRNAMVGMNTVIMDEAYVGENTIVAAMAFVKAGVKLPKNSLVIGAPAKVVRELSADEIAWKSQGTGIYQRLALEGKDKIIAVEPLSEAEIDRPRAQAPSYDPLILQRARTLTNP